MSSNRNVEYIAIVCFLSFVSFALVFAQLQEKRAVALLQGNQIKFDNVAFMSDILEQRVEEIRQLNLNGKPGSEPRVSKLTELEMKVEEMKISLEETKGQNKKMQTNLEDIERLNLKIQAQMEETERKNTKMETKLEESERKITELANTVSKLKGLEVKLLDVESNVESLLRNFNLTIQYKTCAEMRRAYPIMKSGTYWIDPDGQGIGDDPIWVFCDMTKGITSIPHNLEETTSVTKCATPGCYSKSVTYDATNKQIKALADASHICHQSIRYDCYQAPFVKNDVIYSWWNDRHGTKQSFWAGGGPPHRTCECSFNRTCFNNSFSCNCDSLAPARLSDYGVITNKNYLPITRLNFGGTEWPTSSGNHTLGKLNCFDSRIPSSCEDLHWFGHSKNGYYHVKRGQSIDMVFCDFTEIIKQRGLEDMRDQIGQVNVPTPVYFYVTSSSFEKIDGWLKFDQEHVDIGGGMHYNRGEFFSPRSGTYFFILSAKITFNAPRCLIRIKRKPRCCDGGYTIREIDCTKTNSESRIFDNLTIYLEKGNLIDIYLQVEGATTNSNIRHQENESLVHFSGGLL